MSVTAKEFIQLKPPMVLLDAYFDTIPMDCILINNIQGAFPATDYLISQRKQRPGYLHSSYSISNFQERADGFYKAVRSHGMSTSQTIVHHLTPSLEGAYADMMNILEQKENLASCYFADNDLIALGAMKALKKYGFRIPEDIAIIISQAFSVLISFVLIRRQGLPFSFSRKQLRFNRSIIFRICRLGLPCALQDMLVSISFLAITAIVNQLGVVVSAGVGVAEELCAFIMLVPSAYMQSMSAYVAQNIGAGLHSRAKKGMLYGMNLVTIGLSYGLFCLLPGRTAGSHFLI